MHALSAALWAEGLKVRRSKMPWLTSLAFSLIPLTGGLFMMIIMDPEWARGVGLISTKAEITTGTADWPSYFDLLAQAVAVGGLILFGLIVIWLFGREHADRTMNDLLALPVSRATIVTAKLITAAIWSGVMTLIVVGLGMGVGSLVGLPGWSGDMALRASGVLAGTAAMTLLLVCPFVLVTSMTRSYLPPVGFMFLVVVLAQVVAALGWGGYFPWSVPALFSGVAGESARDVHATGYIAVALTGITGIAATLAWWRFADQR